VATAVNGEFIPCTQREATVLKTGDTVLTFQAIVGG
jgi:thiamine biosynthesis protein ThiS